MRGQTIETLKELGLKVTPQRQAILKFLSGKTAHPSADGIYREILKEYPGVSFATVYNTLLELAEAGKVPGWGHETPTSGGSICTLILIAHFTARQLEGIGRCVRLPLFRGTWLRGEGFEGHRVKEVPLNFKGVCKEGREKGQAVDSDYTSTRRRER